jgi:hypothetical protein
MRSRHACTLLFIVLAPARPAAAADPFAHAPAYVKPIALGVEITPLLTTGQRIPHLDTPGAEYLFAGIPDGIGAYAAPEGHLVLLVNHELAQAAGGRAGPLPAGARISELHLDPRTLRITGGRDAIARVFTGEPPAPLDSIPAGFSKFCSSFLADARVGFDRPIYLTGEEAIGEKTFDGRGGQVIALCGRDAYVLSWMGRAKWENVVVLPFTGKRTVVMVLEDGPEDGDGLHSQLYMYVGEKQPGVADPLIANGLIGGTLYVFGANDAGRNSEATFTAKGRSVRGRWIPVDGRLADAAFDAAVKAAGAFGFVRIENGTADPRTRGSFYFATTGERPTANRLGRIYRLRLDPRRPENGATLTLLLDDADGIIAPDNLDLNHRGELVIQEDPGFDLREIGVERDTAVWMYQTRKHRLRRIAEIDRAPGRAHALAVDPTNESKPETDIPGGWETSGALDMEGFLGRGAWLMTVQAHSLRIAPPNETVQGGQLLLLRAR